MGLIIAVIGCLTASVLGWRGLVSSPVFVAAVAALGVATAACAWERTAQASRRWRATSARRFPSRALDERPTVALRAPAGLDAEKAREDLTARLRGLRLRVGRRDEPAGGFVAERGRMGLWGSPVFHVGLAALLIVVAAGRASRSEGRVALPLDVAVRDEAASYQRLTRGPLARGLSGLELVATDLVLDHRSGEVSVGPAPLITLRRGGVAGAQATLARRRVFPNSPLRYGSLLIHFLDHGLAPELELTGPGGDLLGAVRGLSEFDPHRDSGTSATGFRLTAGGGGQEYDGTVEVVADRVRAPGGGPAGVLTRMPARPRVLVRLTPVGRPGDETTQTLALGRAMRLPDGSTLTFTDIRYLARVTVANDWSVMPLYALFAVALAGVSVAIALPYRVAYGRVQEGADGIGARILIAGGRDGGLFGRTVVEALETGQDAWTREGEGSDERDV